MTLTLTAVLILVGGGVVGGAAQALWVVHEALSIGVGVSGFILVMALMHGLWSL